MAYPIGINTFTIAGNLGKAREESNHPGRPEISKDGKTKFLHVSLAVDNSESIKKDSNAKPWWFDLTLIGKDAENLWKYGYPGKRVIFSGHLESGTYTDQNGNARFKINLFVTRMELAGRKIELENPMPAKWGGPTPSAGLNTAAPGVNHMAQTIQAILSNPGLTAEAKNAAMMALTAPAPKAPVTEMATPSNLATPQFKEPAHGTTLADASVELPM